MPDWRRGRARRTAIDALLWLALCILVASGLSNAAGAARYSSVSLRYRQQISGNAAHAARMYSIKNSSDDMFWPTFWREDSAVFSSGHSKTNADYIAYSGDAAFVWNDRYISGTAPGVTDGAGCAVSYALAWVLWGGTDVVGMDVDIGGETRVVRGVFDSALELALVSYSDEGKEQSWSTVELSGGPDGVLRADIESYAVASGLGRADAVLTAGPAYAARALAALPLAIPALYGLALAAAHMCRRYVLARKLTPYVLALAFAALLPTLLEIAPAWMIPTRWSDFSFWPSLVRGQLEGIREFLSATPTARDIELRLLLLRQAVLALASSCCALAVCFRWQMVRNINADALGAGGRKHG